MKTILLLLLMFIPIYSAEKTIIKDSVAIYSPNISFYDKTIESLMIDDLACLMKKGDKVKIRECKFSKQLKYTNCFAMSLSRDCNGWINKTNLK